jgi:hypothetical protein
MSYIYYQTDHKPLLIHWSGAEPLQWEKSLIQNDLYDKLGRKPGFYWFDLMKIFKEEPIIIKGCFSFSLKDIAKTMWKYKMIKTKWDDDNPCSSGIDAMIMALEVYKKYDMSELTYNISELSHMIENDSDMINVIKYNEVDCKVLWEIIEYLRRKFTIIS